VQTLHLYLLDESPRGSEEAIWFKSGHHHGGATGESPEVVCLSLSRWDLADGCEQSMVVEPGHPFQRGKLQRLLGFPWRSAVDQLGFVEAHGLMIRHHQRGTARPHLPREESIPSLKGTVRVELFYAIMHRGPHSRLA